MEKCKRGKKRQKIIAASWFPFPQYTWPLSRCIQNLKTFTLIEAEKSMTEIFIGEKKKNGEIIGMISRRRLILSYTIQQVIPNVCTKFQNLRFSSSWEIFDEKKVYTHTHTNSQTLLRKRQKLYTPIYFVYRGYNNKQQHVHSLLHNTTSHTQHLYQI